MCVLIVGSSHVRRFETYMRVDRDSDFTIANCPAVHYHGISGGRVCRPDHLQILKSKIRQLRPQHLIVHIGGNDLDTPVTRSSDDIHIFVLRLITFLSLCQRSYHIKDVTVLQLCSRNSTRHVPIDKYNTYVQLANRSLKEHLSTISNITYWKLGGMKNGTFLGNDGVHFSQSGFKKYFRAIRGAILYCLAN